jgi:hypothetical protein
MKRFGLLLPWLALTACTSQSSVTARDWRDYVAHPDIGHSPALFKDLQTCENPTCPAMADISDQMVDDLTAQVSAKTLDTVKTSIDLYPLVANRGPVAARLARRIATSIDEDPETYLEAASPDSVVPQLVLATPADMQGNDRAQYTLLRTRREKLAAVPPGYPREEETRGRAISLLNSEVIHLDGRLLRPRPVP